LLQELTGPGEIPQVFGHAKHRGAPNWTTGCAGPLPTPSLPAPPV